METIGTQFDDDKDILILPQPGTYPAHLVRLDRNEVTLAGGDEAYVYNPYFKIAKEAEKGSILYFRLVNGEEIPVTDKKGQQVSGPPHSMVGRRYRADKGIWLTPNVDQRERWRNRLYKELLDVLGIKLPEEKTDAGVVKLLVKLDANDKEVLGKPVLVALAKGTFTGKEGKEITVMRVKGYFPWPNGKQIKVELPKPEAEDAPF